MNRMQVIKNEKKLNIVSSKIKKHTRNQSVITLKNNNYLDFIAKKPLNNYKKLNQPINRIKRNNNLNIKKIPKTSHNTISEKTTSLKSRSMRSIKNAHYKNFKINQMKLYFITRKIIIKHYFPSFIDLLKSFNKNGYSSPSTNHGLKNNINLETLKSNKNFDAKNIIDNISEQLNCRSIRSIKKIYTPRSEKSINDSFSKIISNKTYCFPDNTFRVIKGLNHRDKLLRFDESYKPIPKNIYFNFYELLKYIFKNKTKKNKFSNYNTFNINENKFDKEEVINIINKMNLSTDKYSQNDIIQEKNEELCQSIINKEWIHLPMILIKYGISQNLKKYGKIFLEKLKKISEIKLKELQKEKLIYCYKLIQRKILKHYFRIYRDNIIVTRVQNLIFNNNINNCININENRNKILKSNKKRETKKYKRTLEKRAELFLTKNTKLNVYNKKFIIFNSIIHKILQNNFKKEFLNLLNSYNKNRLSMHSMNSSSVENSQKPKKYIRVKYSSKSVHPISKKNSGNESKTSRETSASSNTKKLKIQKKNIYIITNLKNIVDDISDGDDNKYYLNKIKDVIVKSEMKIKMKYFKTWKKKENE